MVSKAQSFAATNAEEETVRETSQAMEAFLHNLNLIPTRSGAQVPFSSVNYGTDTSREGRIVTFCLLKATQAGLAMDGPVFFRYRFSR